MCEPSTCNGEPECFYIAKAKRSLGHTFEYGTHAATHTHKHTYAHTMQILEIEAVWIYEMSEDIIASRKYHVHRYATSSKQAASEKNSPFCVSFHSRAATDIDLPLFYILPDLRVGVFDSISSE